MRLAVTAALSFLLASGAAGAQTPSCPECILGIYDDPALTSNAGSIAIFEPKEIYVGMQLGGGITDFTGVEFSIAGLDQDGLMLMGMTPLGARPLVFGTVPAPRDTTRDSEGNGGVTAVWGAVGCRQNGEALMKLVLLASEEMTNRILRVKRCYPPTNFTWNAPILTRCDRPLYTATTISGGCYILNPDGPSDCANLNRVAVTATNWSAMKNLYR